MKSAFRIEIKALTEQGTFEGALSVYNVIDQGKDVVEPGAFTKTINDRGGEVPLLWQHKSDVPIGKLELFDTPTALMVKGSLLMELPEAQKAYLLIKAGIIKGLSIGYETVKRVMDGSVRHLKELRLYEGSIVTFPMNELSVITAVKEARASKGDFNEEWAEAQLMSAAWQMRCALAEALNTFIWGGDLTRDERIAGAETSIQQFGDAFMAMFPDLLDLLAQEGSYYGMGMMSLRSAALSRKAGARHSAADKQRILDAIDLLQALVADEAGSTTSSEEAAKSQPEPVEDHSAAQSLIESIRSLIPTAA